MAKAKIVEGLFKIQGVVPVSKTTGNILKITLIATYKEESALEFQELFDKVVNVSMEIFKEEPDLPFDE